MLEYKLKLYGIRFVRQEESYSSQCSPLSPEVGRKYAEPCKRKQRGLYRDGKQNYNADAVGAYNILRKYHSVSGVKKELRDRTENTGNHKSSCIARKSKQ